MSEHLLETVVGENESLALHVDLCQKRYLQLLSKFDTVEIRLDTMGDMLRAINTKLNETKTSALEIYLRWAGVIIMTLLGIVMHYAIK